MGVDKRPGVLLEGRADEEEDIFRGLYIALPPLQMAGLLLLYNVFTLTKFKTKIRFFYCPFDLTEY